MITILKMATRVLWLLVMVNLVFGEQEHAREGLMDHLSNGMKFATNFLGSESIALKVAEFVVRAFQNVNTTPDSKPIRRRPAYDAYSDSSSNEEAYEKKPYYNISEVPNPMAPLKHLVRLFGLRPNQISAVAINALVFVAQMISSFLAGPKRPNRYRTEDPTSWILTKNNRRLQDLINAAKNKTLAEAVEDTIKNQGSDEDTSCLKLLVCKITPFVNKMQIAVFGNDSDVDFDKNLRGSAILYRHLPSAEEINRTSNVCEQKYRDCDLNEI